MEYKSDRRPIRESNLVSEQPGFFILFLGLFFAIVVGLSIRTAAQSEWFHARLKEAIVNVGSEWRIQYGRVGLYFKDGITPAIGLYADDVKIASESLCYMKSGGFAQKIKVPLSLIKYVMDGQLVNEIVIEDFKVEITEKAPVCDKTELSKIEKSNSVLPETRKKNQIAIVDRVERSHLRNEIERVVINKLEVYYPDEKYDYFLMRNIVIENKSSHPKILFMEGDVDLNPFVKSNEGQKLANLKIEYSEFPERIIKSNLLGSLREGFFSVQLINRLDDKKFQFQAELKNVSLSMIKRFIPAVPKELDLKSNWLSTKVYIEGLANSISTAVANVRDASINGDLGELMITDLVFSKGIGYSPNPFQVKLKNMNVSKLWSLLQGPKTLAQIESMGTLNGNVDILNETSGILDAQLSGLELVFSAHGVRRTEKINVGKISGGWKKNMYLLELKNIQNGYGVVEGFMGVKSGDLKTYDVNAQLKNIHLSSTVSKLVTRTETPFVLDDILVRAQATKSDIDYKIHGKMKQLSYEYFEMSNVNFTVSGHTERAQEIDVRADRWQNTQRMQSSLAAMSVVMPVLIAKPKIKLMRNSNGLQMRAEGQNGIKLNAVLTGGDILNGSISTKDQEWKVYGTRDNFKIDKK